MISICILPTDGAGARFTISSNPRYLPVNAVIRHRPPVKQGANGFTRHSDGTVDDRFADGAPCETDVEYIPVDVTL